MWRTAARVASFKSVEYVRACSGVEWTRDGRTGVDTGGGIVFTLDRKVARVEVGRFGIRFVLQDCEA